MLSVLQPAKLPCSLNSHDISMNTLRHNDVGTSTRLSLHRFDSFASSEDSTSSNYDHDYGSKPAHIFTSSQGKEVARFRSIVDSWSSTASFSSLLHTITIAVPPTCIRELEFDWLLCLQVSYQAVGSEWRKRDGVAMKMINWRNSLINMDSMISKKLHRFSK